MMKSLRETLREISSAGGTDLKIAHGGKHTLISFTTAVGERRRITISKGTKIRSVRRSRALVRKGSRGAPATPGEG